MPDDKHHPAEGVSSHLGYATASHGSGRAGSQWNGCPCYRARHEEARLVVRSRAVGPCVMLQERGRRLARSPAGAPDAAKTNSGLATKVLTPGTGKTRPGPTDTVKVHYTGWTKGGQMFDSSVA